VPAIGAAGRLLLLGLVAVGAWLGRPRPGRR
jgi:hypothetical protein